MSQNNPEGKDPLVLSAAKLTAMKRKRDGAERRTETAEKTIAKIISELKKPNLSLSERRHLNGKLVEAKKIHFKARTEYSGHDKEYRDARQAANEKNRNELAGMRFEAKHLPKFDTEFFPSVMALLKKAADEHKHDAVHVQLELNRFAGDGNRVEFNRTFTEFLAKVDENLASKIGYAPRLKRKLNDALFKHFEDVPSYLPQNSFEVQDYDRIYGSGDGEGGAQ